MTPTSTSGGACSQRAGGAVGTVRRLKIVRGSGKPCAVITGGYGPARSHRRRRNTTAEVPRLHLRDLAPLPAWAEAVWMPGRDGSGRTEVGIEWAPAGFGGRRPCLVCPCCARHVIAVYRVRGAWVCRRCGNLVYPSTREKPSDRALRKARQARERLGFDCSFPWPISALGKPRGMRWRTYEKLVRDVERADDRAVREMLAGLPPKLQAAFLGLNRHLADAVPLDGGGRPLSFST